LSDDVHANGLTTRKPSIFLLVRSLDTGGAERQLTQLALGLRERQHRVQVGVFYQGGPLASELERAEIPIFDLGKRGRWDLIGFLFRLRRVLQSNRPDVIYSFLGGANIVAAAVRPFVSELKLAWSVRASDMDLSRYDWTHRLGARVERLLARAPDIIIANSAAGRQFAVRNGFPADRIALVPNGIDTERFRPDAALRKVQRRYWGLLDGERAIGVLGRLDPMKDHETFLRSAALLAPRFPELRFLCIGDGPRRGVLEGVARDLAISDRVLFAGAAEPAAALNALDLVCSSSTTEGFPNAIAEAMACGKLCVVTDVGDCAIIVEHNGTVVPPRDPEALGRAILHELRSGTPKKSAAARRCIVQRFSAAAMVEQTLGLLSEVVLRP
jgi:glycosyltransferase involved in cell wall biosynthesis